MKAITLWEPWASAMALGKKHNETRGYPTKYRGPLVICAAKRLVDIEQYELVIQLGVDVATWRPPYGCAVCVVELYDSVPTDFIHYGMNRLVVDETEKLFGDYSMGRYAWKTRNLRKLKTPVPVLGRQGFFEVDEGLIARVL